MAAVSAAHQLWTACLDVESAQATVAVRLEWAHAEFVGQSEGLAVVGCGRLDLRGLALCRDLAMEPQGPHLVAAFLAGEGEGKGTHGAFAGLIPAASQEIHLAQPGDSERLVVQESRAVSFLQRLLKQWERLGHTPGQGIGVSQG
jgi:hypothetical protein